jgi:hypothetical protein
MPTYWQFLLSEAAAPPPPMSAFGAGGGGASGLPIVSMEFTKNGEKVKSISISDAAPVDINAVSLESRASNTRFEYSGRHDHGDLPQLRSTGDSARLVTALQEAKAACDEYLTQCIRDEYGYAVAEISSVRVRSASSAAGDGQGAGEMEAAEDGSPAPTGSVPKKLRVEEAGSS